MANEAALGNKLPRSAKIPIDYQIQPRYGVGPVADWRAPTILAWDWTAVERNLQLEANSP